MKTKPLIVLILLITCPTVRAMLNVTSFFRIGIGGGYRLVSGVDLDDLKDSEISGPSAEIVLKFGKF